MKQKIKLVFLMLICSICSYAQIDEQCIPQYPDSTAIVNLPWYGNNQFLVNFLNSKGYYDGNPQARTTACPEKYLIPVSIWIYRDNAGNASSAISASDAEDIVRQANDLFVGSSSRIRIFIKNIYFDANENYRTGLQSVGASASMFAAKGLAYGNGQFNIHIIKNYAQSSTARGFASLPMFPNLPGAYKSCWVKTHFTATGSKINNTIIATTLTHELGHTLGLLHTHHPGRLPSLALNATNATISNGCYQESVSRTRRNYWYDGCLSTDNKLKSEVNGDFISDTNADPRVSSGGQIGAAPGCGYTWNNGNTDYQVDNWGEVWTPPTRNIMSYSSYECRNQFSINQIGVMWYYADQFAQSYQTIPKISGPDIVPCSSVGFSAPTSFTGVLSYYWSVTGGISVVSGQGTSSIAVIATSTGNAKIYLDITTTHGNFCIEKPVTSNGALPPAAGSITSDGASCPEYSFNVAYVPNVTYTWQYFKLPSGPVTSYPNSASTKRIVFTQNGSYRVGVKTVNGCGSSSISFVDINVSCNGSGNRFALYPNPVENEITISFADEVANEEKTVDLINFSSETVLSKVTKENLLHLDVSEFPKGKYIIQIIESGKKVKKQILIAH